VVPAEQQRRGVVRVLQIALTLIALIVMLGAGVVLVQAIWRPKWDLADSRDAAGLFFANLWAVALMGALRGGPVVGVFLLDAAISVLLIRSLLGRRRRANGGRSRRA
jgi:hypothetical protein